VGTAATRVVEATLNEAAVAKARANSQRHVLERIVAHDAGKLTVTGKWKNFKDLEALRVSRCAKEIAFRGRCIEYLESLKATHRDDYTTLATEFNKHVPRVERLKL
jgi:hypothetical protein